MRLAAFRTRRFVMSALVLVRELQIAVGGQRGQSSPDMPRANQPDASGSEPFFREPDQFFERLITGGA